MTQAGREGTGLGTRRCAGQECRGRAGQLGAARAATREGARREGAEPGARREGRVAARRGGGRPPAQWGLGIPTKALEEVMGRSLGCRGPGARGSSPHCAAAVRCPVPAGLSEAQGPAAPAPPPSALPRRGPAPPRPPFPPQGPGHSLCKRRPSRALGSLPNRSAYLGTGPLCPPGGRERGRNRAGGPDKGAETTTQWEPGENQREQDSAALDGCAPPPCPIRRGERRGSGPQPLGHFCAPWGGWTLAPNDGGGGGGRKLASRSQGWLQLSKLGGPSAAQRSDLGEWGPHLLLPPRGPGPVSSRG